MKKHFLIFGIIIVLLLFAANLVINFANSQNTKFLNTKISPEIDDFFLKCNQNVRYSIENVCYDIRASELRVKIKNYGTIQIAGMSFITQDNFVMETSQIVPIKSSSEYVLYTDSKPTSIKVVPKIFEGEFAQECATLNQTTNAISFC